MSVPHPEQTTKVVAQVLGELQLPAQTVKVFGQQSDATEPEWERDVEIQPIAKFAANRSRDREPEIDRQKLDPAPPSDIGYTFVGEAFPDTVTGRNNFKLVATPAGGKLHSFVGFVYTIEQGSDRWIAKTDACVSNAPSFYPPTVTVSNGVVTCGADSKLASEAKN